MKTRNLYELRTSKVYSESIRTSKMELCAEIGNGFQLLFSQKVSFQMFDWALKTHEFSYTTSAQYYITVKTSLQRAPQRAQNSVCQKKDVPYIDLLSKLTHFASNLLQGVAVQGNKPQVCQEAGVGRRKSQYIRKTIYQRISCLYDNLENTGQLVFAMRERANQRSGKECCCCFSY